MHEVKLVPDTVAVDWYMEIPPPPFPALHDVKPVPDTVAVELHM